MRFVDAAEVRRVLTFPILIAGLEAAHRRPKIEVQDGFLGSEKEQYLVRHAVDRGRFMASKLITSFPANLTGGKLPAVLAPSEPNTLLVVGAGAMSKWLTRAHCTVRPSLRHVLVWNRTPERAAEIAALLAQEGIAVE